VHGGEVVVFDLAELEEAGRVRDIALVTVVYAQFCAEKRVEAAGDVESKNLLFAAPWRFGDEQIDDDVSH
jgi:hypothetical protein